MCTSSSSSSVFFGTFITGLFFDENETEWINMAQEKLRWCEDDEHFEEEEEQEEAMTSASDSASIARKSSAVIKKSVEVDTSFDTCSTAMETLRMLRILRKMMMLTMHKL